MSPEGPRHLEEYIQIPGGHSIRIPEQVRLWRVAGWELPPEHQWSRQDDRENRLPSPYNRSHEADVLDPRRTDTERVVIPFQEELETLDWLASQRRVMHQREIPTRDRATQIDFFGMDPGALGLHRYDAWWARTKDEIIARPLLVARVTKVGPIRDYRFPNTEVKLEIMRTGEQNIIARTDTFGRLIPQAGHYFPEGRISYKTDDRDHVTELPPRPNPGDIVLGFDFGTLYPPNTPQNRQKHVVDYWCSAEGYVAVLKELLDGYYRFYTNNPEQPVWMGNRFDLNQDLSQLTKRGVLEGSCQHFDFATKTWVDCPAPATSA